MTNVTHCPKKVEIVHTEKVTVKLVSLKYDLLEQFHLNISFQN